MGHRIQIAWMRFYQHRDILTNKHLSIYSRIKFFNTVITPTILFGLSSCAMTRARMCSLDALQRRMLRKIVGWTRLVDEPWEDTMRRMRLKVDSALTKYPMEDWSAQLLRRQFRLAYRVGSMIGSWPARLSRWHPPTTFPGAGRGRGRPAVRWDDYLRRFSHASFGTDWIEAALTKDFATREDDFVQFSIEHQQ